MKILFGFFIIIFFPFFLNSQNQIKIDSLENEIKLANDDSNKINTLNALVVEYKNYGNYIKAKKISADVIHLSQKINFKKGEAIAYITLGNINSDQGNYSAALENYFYALSLLDKMLLADSNQLSIIAKKSSLLNNFGVVYRNQGDYSKALEYHLEAIKMDKLIDRKIGIAGNFGNIGLIYDDQGDYPKALEYYFKALKIFEDLKENQKIASALTNIGNVYDSQSDYTKALENYFKALKVAEELGNKKLIAINLGNIGNAYNEKSELITNSIYQKDSLLNNALEYYFKALKIDEALENKSGLSVHLGNIGIVYKKKNIFSKALDYFFKALNLADEIKDKFNMAIWFENIGTLHIEDKKYEEAEKYLLSALLLSKEIGTLNQTRKVEQALSELYTKTEKHKLALEHFKKYISARDSIFNEENTKKIVREEMNFEFEKKQAVEKAEQEKKNAIAAAESKKQKIIIYSTTGGLFLVVLLLIFIFRGYKQKQKANLIIAEQKKHIEEKHKETTDSITYAKRLQHAILPPTELIKKYFPDSFVLYNPKDIVAGDFYWMETCAPAKSGASVSDEEIVFIAAADCTGHGVPGAMVSVVCSNALNRAVKEFGLRDTGKILDKVTDLVLETFEKSASEVKDGMDISLLAFNMTSKQIQWSGANNPLWYIHNGQVVEIKADKQPVGKFDKRKSFTAHSIEHSDNSVFYLFTDGLPDQFGGPKGKKFMYKRFENNLTDISKLPMDEQQAVLEKAFQDWKGSLEQVDDVTVIGIKI